MLQAQFGDLRQSAAAAGPIRRSGLQTPDRLDLTGRRPRAAGGVGLVAVGQAVGALTYAADDRALLEFQGGLMGAGRDQEIADGGQVLGV